MAATNTIAIPPRISTRIQTLIAQHDGKLIERRALKEYTGYDDFYKRQNEADKATLDNTLKELERQLLDLCRKYLDGVVVFTGSIEEIKAMILVALPADSGVKMATFVNARMQTTP